MPKPSILRSFSLHILFPAFLAIILFIIAIFFVIIPSIEKNLLDEKREMITELNHSAWSLVESFYLQQKNGDLTQQQAKQEAIYTINSLRYGEEGKDYFWITDTRPFMVVHPYRSDLNGKDLGDFTDPNGKRLFVDFVNIVQANGEGYVDYYWQWKDDSTRIVPKLSYVKGFAPWGWIIGTGIYIEDVRFEISRITNRLIKISLLIVFIISLILTYIARQNFKLEKLKQSAEYELQESRERYKSLVEASTEGTLMIMDYKIIFANQTIQSLLGFTETELTVLPLDSLIELNNDTGRYLTDLLSRHDQTSAFEAQFIKADGSPLEMLISLSQIDIFGKEGQIIVARDISSHKKIQNELGESRQKFQVLTETINIGVFRIQLSKTPRFIEMNPAGMNILGIDKNELDTIALSELFQDPEEANVFYRILEKEKSIKDRVVRIKKMDGTVCYISISAIIGGDEHSKEKFIDGILEDVSEIKKTEQMRDEIITGLNTSLIYLNQPVIHFAQYYPKIAMGQSIQSTAREMKKFLAGAALIVSDDESVIGIVTDEDMWKRVICDNIALSSPVYKIMTSPVMTISENALIFEALLVMQEQSIRHLPLADINGNINSMISSKEIIQIQQYSAGLLIQEIQKSDSIDDLADKSKTLPHVIKSLIDSGVNISTITRIISSVGDSVAHKCIEFAIQQLGPAPCKFAFLVLGSQGREEQTFATDQDNAILYENTSESVQPYFLKLAAQVNDGLDKAGYHYCKGEVMARNKKWCTGLESWKQHFNHWIHHAEPQDLIDIGIFFDFRCLYGDQELATELRNYVLTIVQDQAPFFNHLAKNSLLVKPPLNLMGNISTKSGDVQHKGVDIKHSLLPVIDFGRIYSLQHGLSVTNTLKRLFILKEKNIINFSTFQDIAESYEYLMMLRFKHQIHIIEQNQQPDNLISTIKLSDIEKHMLKKVFSHLGVLQKKLSFDFTGTAL